jgi:hypothetical protein
MWQSPRDSPRISTSKLPTNSQGLHHRHPKLIILGLPKTNNGIAKLRCANSWVRRSPVTSDFPRPKTRQTTRHPPYPNHQALLDKPRQKPISLAAFMGSRETGPRMNKHAPQQDAHDPTQFEQRRSITSPHPVFGKNGVAMPGLAPKSPGPSIARLTPVGRRGSWHLRFSLHHL